MIGSWFKCNKMKEALNSIELKGKVRVFFFLKRLTNQTLFIIAINLIWFIFQSSTFYFCELNPLSAFWQKKIEVIRSIKFVVRWCLNSQSTKTVQICKTLNYKLNGIHSITYLSLSDFHKSIRRDWYAL